MNDANTPEWMKDVSVQQIDKEKLAFLNSCYEAMQGKDKKELMMVLRNQMQIGKQKGLQFTGEEMNIAVAAIKKYNTPENNQKIDDILSGKIKKPF